MLTRRARLLGVSALALLVGPGALRIAAAASLHGSADIEYRYFSEPQPQDELQNHLSSRLRLEILQPLSAQFEFYAEPVLYLSNGPQVSGAIDDIRELSEDSYAFNLEECTLGWFGDTQELKIGKQIFAWGVTDGFSPVDGLNPLDVTRLPPDKIGVFAVDYARDFDRFAFEAAWIPWFTPARLAGLDNRWLGNLDEVLARFGLPVVPPFAREIPEVAADSMGYAFRLTSSSLLEGWDLGLSFLASQEPIGVYRLDPPLFPPPAPPVPVFTRVFPRQFEPGASFSTVLGSVEVHGEVVGHFTEDPTQDNDYLEFVIGGNYTWYEIPGGWCQEIFLSLEFNGEVTLEERALPSPYIDVNSYFRPFSNTLFAGLKFTLDADTKIETAHVYDVEDHDSSHTLFLTRTFASNWEFRAGFDAFRGRPETSFGNWRDNGSAYFFLQRTY